MKDLAIECVSGSHSLHIKKKAIRSPKYTHEAPGFMTFCHYFEICLETLTMWLRTEMVVS